MAFDYPSVATEKRKAKEKAKKNKVSEKEFEKIISPITSKKEGSKKELSMEQFERAMSEENIGEGKKITKKGLKNIVDAATDDKQLTRTKRSMSRHGVSPLKHYNKGGRAGYKGGGMSTRGLGRAFMKGGKV
tara:strand:- start:202 stop:597 length:396 start_codon:yes stop_codon:yes gene_type:complete